MVGFEFGFHSYNRRFSVRQNVRSRISNRGLQVLRSKSRVFSDACQHSRANFVVVMKREDEIRPVWS